MREEAKGGGESEGEKGEGGEEREKESREGRRKGEQKVAHSTGGWLRVRYDAWPPGPAQTPGIITRQNFKNGQKYVLTFDCTLLKCGVAML